MKRLGSKGYLLSQRHFIIGLFFVAVVMIIVAFMIIALRSQSPREPSIGKQSIVNTQTLFKNYTVHYPIFHDQQLDAIMTTYIKGEVDRFEKSLVGQNDIRNHLTISYVLTHYGNRNATINFTRTEEVVGQPDITSTKHMMLDLEQKRQLGVQDIIQQTPSARRILSRLLHDGLKQQALPPLGAPELVRLLEMPLDRIQNISLEVNTVTIHLTIYDTVSSQETVAISISKNLLKDVLTDRYRANDPDMVAVNSTKSDYQIITPPASDAINPADKMIAFTFDDGPGDLTTQLLDTLDMYKSHATFFVLGHLASTYQTTLQRMIREGNEIGNHSWNHSDLRLLSNAELDYQVIGTEQAIQAATGGYRPTRMRPPYGGTNPAVEQYLASRNLAQTLWNVDTNDWRDRDVNLVYARIMEGAADGRIILLHDIHPTSVQAALRAIRDLKAQGYQLVTVSQLYQYRG